MSYTSKQQQVRLKAKILKDRAQIGSHQGHRFSFVSGDTRCFSKGKAVKTQVSQFVALRAEINKLHNSISKVG